MWEQSMQQAMGVCRPGGSIGYVGVPHGVSFDGQQLFFRQQRMLGDPAPVRRFLPDLMDRVLQGRIQPGKVFDLVLPIAEVAEGYKAMDFIKGVRDTLHAYQPAGRAGTPDEVAALAAHITGPEGGFITGSDFLIDGGATANFFYGSESSQS